MNIYEYIVDQRMHGNAYVLDELATFLHPCKKPEKVNPRLDVWCDIHGVEVNSYQRKTIADYLLGTVHPRCYSYQWRPIEMSYDMIETLLLVEWKYI